MPPTGREFGTPQMHATNARQAEDLLKGLAPLLCPSPCGDTAVPQTVAPITVVLAASEGSFYQGCELREDTRNFLTAYSKHEKLSWMFQERVRLPHRVTELGKGSQQSLEMEKWVLPVCPSSHSQELGTDGEFTLLPCNTTWEHVDS